MRVRKWQCGKKCDEENSVCFEICPHNASLDSPFVFSWMNISVCCRIACASWHYYVTYEVGTLIRYILSLHTWLSHLRKCETQHRHKVPTVRMSHVFFLYLGERRCAHCTHTDDGSWLKLFLYQKFMTGCDRFLLVFGGYELIFRFFSSALIHFFQQREDSLWIHSNILELKDFN